MQFIPFVTKEQSYRGRHFLEGRSPEFFGVITTLENGKLGPTIHYTVVDKETKQIVREDSARLEDFERYLKAQKLMWA